MECGAQRGMEGRVSIEGRRSKECVKSTQAEGVKGDSKDEDLYSKLDPHLKKQSLKWSEVSQTIAMLTDDGTVSEVRAMCMCVCVWKE